MGKKILFIPNMPYWSLEKNARDIIKYNQSDLYFEICQFGEYVKNNEKLYNEFDLVFPMTNRLFDEFLIRGFPVDKVITGIRSFVSWDNNKTVPPGYNAKPPRRFIKHMKKALMVNTNCLKLWYVFSRHFPVVYTKYACDLEVFFPEDNKKSNNKLVAGWAGSLTNNENVMSHNRGYFDIIKPACEAVEGVELRAQIAEEEWIRDDNKMREFYNSIDLYICASKSESGPRTVLEAAACGVPSLTTDVGLVPELIENNVNGIIVERKTDAFAEQLRHIVANREMLAQMGGLVRKKMEKEFNWEKNIPHWIDFFQRAVGLYQLRKENSIK
jgi:glycosyltransferase involved in cell wall biosynthesis